MNRPRALSSSGSPRGAVLRRLCATLRRDVILQHRYRFYAVSLLMVTVWGGLLSLVLRTGQVDEVVVVPAFMAINGIVTTFYFMAAMILLERTEGMLAAVVVSPLRFVEYFASKVITLSMLALAESLFIVVLAFGWPDDLLPLVAGTLVLGTLYVLAGFISVARYDAMNEWIMPSAVVVTLLSLPLVPHLGLGGTGFVRIHPIEPAFVLMRAGYEPVGAWDLVYAVAASVQWVVGGTMWARWRFERFVVRAAGER